MPGMPVEDLELVERARKGDVAAFTELVKRYEVRIYNLARRLLHDADDAAEAAQEAFLAAYEGLGGFRADASFYTWLYRIVLNKALSVRRARESRRDLAAGGDDPAALDRTADGADGPYERTEKSERARMVREAIDALGDDFRAVVVLKDMEGLEYEEIAEIIEAPLGTVKSRLHRARLLLKDALAPYIDAAP